MHLTSVILLGTCVALAATAPTTSRHVLHEKRDATPRAWTKRDRVDPEQLLPVRIGLIQSNLEHGPGMLDEV